MQNLSSNYLKSAYEYMLSSIGLGKKEKEIPHEPFQKKSFTQEEDELYHSISIKLLEFSKSRFVHPIISPDEGEGQSSARKLTFCQSYSWTKIEGMLLEIKSTDEEVKDWVTIWINRIKNFRIQQMKVRESIKQINDYEKLRKKLDCSQNVSPFDANQLFLLMEDSLNRELDAREHIHIYLIEGMHNLSNLDPKIENNAPCMKIVSFILENWSFLSAFASWPETIDVDSHTINFKLESFENLPENVQSFANSVNNSTQAIFIIHQTAHEIKPLPYKGPASHLYCPTQIAIKASFLDKSCLEEPISVLSDGDLYGFSYQNVFGPLEMAKNIPTIVNAAVQEVNSILDNKDLDVDNNDSDLDVDNNDLD